MATAGTSRPRRPGGGLSRPKRAGHTPSLGSTHGGPLRRLPPRAAVGRDVRRGRPSRARPTPACSRRCSRSPARSWPPAPTCCPRPTATPGVTFAHAGEEQPFPLDIVPRVIGAEEWDGHRARASAQRVHALEAFLADVYGAGQVFADRVVPRSVVTTSAHFHRAGARAGAAQRRPRARLRHRPGARRGRRLPGARGQPPLAVGRQLRHHQPARR